MQYHLYIKSYKFLRDRVMFNYILLIVYMVVAVSGSIFMKTGNAFTLTTIRGKIIFSTTIISFIGFILYFCSFIMWTKLLTKFNLSYLVPITGGISTTALVILGCIIFHEKLNIYQIIGIVAVIIGVSLLNIKK
jgi:small multidrug resistance pump